MALTVGSRIGPFEITGELGVGGMGEVYRAVDANLGRSVAIKVLPDAFARDPERLARFEREAKTLASLNHSNIAQVFGLEKGGTDLQMRALVMELVEGPTLADRIAKGPIPLDEAVPIAIQIAEALESAHDQGIVHRDLKPANVKVRDDGTVKVLDFGLAKAMAPAGEAQSGTLANSPTITSAGMTQAGVVLGTAAYMSPEQAKGRAVNQRADIWAFGCVLFEMLTGTRAFPGEDISDVLVAIIRDEPSWQALPPSTPAHIRALLRRCLQKDVKKRMPHIGMARLELVEGGTFAENTAVPKALTARRLVEWLAMAAAGAAVAIAAAVALRPAPPVAEQRGTVRFELAPPEGGMFQGSGGVPRFAMSPDGRAIVYQASASGQVPQLWLRRLDLSESRPLVTARSLLGATDLSSQQPFWSPDGQEVAFFDERAGKLKIVEVNSGTIRSLCDVPGNQMAGSWSDDGHIVFASLGTGGVRRILATGGSIEQLTTLAEGEASHLWPDLMPDGRHFVYLVTAGNHPGIYLGSLTGQAPRRMIDSIFMARVAPPNRLLYVRGDALVSQEFDTATFDLVGEPVTVADSVMRTAAGRVAVSASRRGDLVYRAGDFAGDAAEAVWISRAGVIDETVPAVPTSGFGLRLSGDGRTLAYTRSEGPGTRIWLQDVERRVPSQLPSDPASSDAAPLFSSDSSQLFYRRDSGQATAAMLRQQVSGVSAATVVFTAPQAEFVTPVGVTADGQSLLFSATRGSARGIFVHPLAGGGSAVPYHEGVRSIGNRASNAALSPDNRLLAHAMGPLGAQQIFLQTFPDATRGRWPVSGPGGSYPRWRRDGRELYFVDQQLWVNAVSITTANAPEIGNPTRLFALPALHTLENTPYDVAPDGQRFIVTRRRVVGRPTTLSVALNWQAGLKNQ